MGIQRYATASGSVRYRARIKFHGREVATRVFERRRDAEAWEREQKRRLHLGEWFDPRRGRVPLESVAEEWLSSRRAVKRRTRETDESTWRLHVEPRFGDRPVSSITTAEVEQWVGSLVSAGHSASSVNRYLATLRSVLNHAVRDSRITVNPAAFVRPPSGAHTRREGRFLTLAQLWALRDACAAPYADVVPVLGLAGLRWGELAGLQVGDLLALPGAGLRLQRTVLASRADGQLFIDSLKNNRARSVPLVADLVPIVAGWATGKRPADLLFAAPAGGPLSEANWKRSVGWTKAIQAIGMPGLRVHDLRHTAASVWLGAGADPKVVQRILGHASAAMTMDLYGHLIDQNLWDAAKRIDEVSQSGGTAGARAGISLSPASTSTTGKPPLTSNYAAEPVTGVEPATSSLQVRRSTN
jgi:integrase